MHFSIIVPLDFNGLDRPVCLLPTVRPPNLVKPSFVTFRTYFFFFSAKKGLLPKLPNPDHKKQQEKKGIHETPNSFLFERREKK